jgi:hypothetical protein
MSDPATYREFDDFREEVRKEFTAMKTEMREGFKALTDSQWLGPQGRTFLSGAGLVSAFAAIILAIFH